jgi:hypothetical protein
MNLKPFCLFFDSSLAVHQTNTYSGNSAPLKFQCLLLFFLEQHPILLDRNGVHCLEKRPMHQEQKASSYYVLLEYAKALNDYQCSWMRTRIVISWWLKALLSLFMTKKERYNFNGTWTSSVPSNSLYRRSLSTLEDQHLFKQIYESSHFTFTALNFLLIINLCLNPVFIFHLHQSSRPQVGELMFQPCVCLINEWNAQMDAKCHMDYACLLFVSSFPLAYDEE